MEEPDGAARGREDRAGAARLGGEEGGAGGGGGGLAVAAVVHDLGGGLGGDEEVSGAEERRLAVEEGGGGDNGGDFSEELDVSDGDISAPFGGRDQIGEEKGFNLHSEWLVDMAGAKQGGFPAQSGESAEPGDLPTCLVSNGGVWNNPLFAPCYEGICSSDPGLVCDTLDKATEGRKCEQRGLAGKGGDLGGVTDVKAIIKDLQVVCEKPRYDYEALSDLHHFSNERWPRVVDGVGFVASTNNELKQDDLLPKLETDVSRLLDENSVPSVSGSIDDSLDGKAVQAGEIFSDFVTCVDDGGFWGNVLCAPLAEGYQSKDGGHMHDMVSKVTEGSQCGQAGLAGEGDVVSGGMEVHTSLEDLEMCSEEPHCDKGLSDLAKLGIQQLPFGMDVTCLKKGANYELEKDGLLPNTRGATSRPMNEDSVPSISGSCIDVPFGAKAGQIAEIAEYGTAMEKVSCDSQGGVVLSFESRFWKESCGDENQCSRMEIKTSEKDLQTGQMEPCHENGCLLDSGKHGTEKLSLGADGLGFITNVNHELEKDVFLPNIDAEVSCPVDEAAVPSIYEGPIDAPLYGKAGCFGEISESRTCMEKLARDSLGVDMILCGNGFRVEASGDENHHFRIGVSKGLTTSVSKEANSENMRSFDPCAEIEFPLQQTPERDLTSYSYNGPCEDEPCCSGRDTSTGYLLDHRDSDGRELDSSDHLALELATCNYTDGKAGPVDFTENRNDVESQNQNSAPVIVFRRRNPKRAASSRNSNIEKSDQINKAINSTRKSKKVVSPSSLLKSTVIKFPNKTTKGRSGINRPPKSSVWGSLQKLIDGFGQNCDPSTSHSHLTCRRKERSDIRADDKKQLTIRKSRSSRCSKNKYTSFSNMGSAEDELNGQPTFSVMADTNVSSEGHIGNDLKSGPYALVNGFDGAHRTAQCTEGNHTLKLTSIQTDAQQLEKGLENITQEICPAYIHGECAISTSERSLNNTDVGFSPDSVLDIASVTCENNTAASLDVIVRDSSDHVALTGGALRASALSTSDFRKYHDSSSMILEQHSKTVRGDRNKRKGEIYPSHAMMDDICEGEGQASEKSNTLRRHINVESHECQKKDGKKGNNINHISSAAISSNDAFSKDSSSLDPSGLLLCTRPPKSGSCYEAFTSITQDIGMHGCDSMQGPSETDNDNGKGIAFDSMKSLRREKKDDHGGKKRKVQGPHEKGKSKKKNISDDTILDSGSYSLPLQLADLAAFHMNEQSDHSPATELAFKNPAAICTKLPTNVACKTDAASVPPLQRAAWVCCDDCQKWRCIPAELADFIGEASRRWTCKDNEDKRFADCTIAQEKTNAEINAELELSDASADEANNDVSNSKASRAPSWTHVRSNLFLHRNRRTQSIDESMVCNCKLSQDGRMGCKDGCLNRMLNIECAKRTCPCGEHCSNQQFQRRNYAKLSWFHSGKKGYGLQLKEDVSEGRFLIEYVGEVLHITAYEARQKLYASKGQKHFYFMALNGGEVIDACTKGNLGRFINHSCTPNCRTEKWMVNGEVCIGIFAMRNIKKGEELTFDYNYVRVSGAAPQKCFCGTAKCRGYIGGDISGSGAASIVQDDAEAGNFEPMAIDKDVEVLVANESCSHGANPDIVDDEDSVKGEDSNDCPSATPELEPEQQTSETLFDITVPENFLEALSPQDSEDVIRTPVHVSRTVDCSLQQFPVYGTEPSEFLQRIPYTLDEQKAPNTMNGTTSSSDLGSNLVPGSHANKKNNIKQHKNVKASSSSVDNEHILGVERRLTALLDEGRGISKRKDATNGYLKLLVVTAAEGDNAGGTSKSVRDLSLILEALLKTQSNAVLLDIINKNGLQMLHNMLKQNRTDFLRTPIIRKLLKVLEFLANRKILTSEHINGGPRYNGVESFRDSMLRLTRHNDTRVQHMARNFRDKWISRNMFRNEIAEYPRASTSAHDIRGISMAGGSVSTSTSMDCKSIRRKRKSRWDYQPDEHYKMVGIKVQKVCLGHSELDLQSGLMGNKLQGNCGTNCTHNAALVIGSSIECADDEAPPGFEPQQECWPAQACLDGGVAPGLCLDRYQHNLTISYGIPVAFVEHFGTPEVGDQCGKKWKVAPGVPFNPFPPLPPYPRGSTCPSTSTSQMSQHEHNSSGYCGRTADRGGRVHKNWRNGARTRFGYNHQGRRFPSNHHRFERCRAPRSEEHDDSGSRGRE